MIRQYRPDYVIILPWNIQNEISHEMSYIHHWGGQFVVAIPTLEIFSKRVGVQT